MATHSAFDDAIGGAVVGHTKTVIVLTGGCLLFGEEMPLGRLSGVCCALVGIVWFSALKLKAGNSPAKASGAPAKASTPALENHHDDDP